MTPDPLVASLPDDALVLLIGPSGSGKSTWAAKRFRHDQILSSDAFRALVAGDAADQSATADAFKVLHLVAKSRLRRGLLTVVDAPETAVRLGRESAGQSGLLCVTGSVFLAAEAAAFLASDRQTEPCAGSARPATRPTGS